MSRHPVTPMKEADLCRHLAEQTSQAIALIDIHHLHQAALDAALANAPAAILFDTLDEFSVNAVGTLLWNEAQLAPVFAAGSSGLTRSLITAWRTASLIPNQPSLPSTPRAEQMLVLSGSCSPITASQIEWGLAHGFTGIALNPSHLLHNPAALDDILHDSLSQIHAGRSLILYTALGPLASSSAAHGADLGTMLGRLLRSLFEQSPLRRAVLCGGDTSSHAMQQLDIAALTWMAPVAPGAPLCRAHAPGTPFHHAEFILKGGQVGPANFFELARGAS